MTGAHGTRHTDSGEDPGGKVRLVECPSRNDIEWILSAIKDFLVHGHPTESQLKSLNRVSAKLNSVLASQKPPAV